jgi:dehydrogenase/reductase SDR family member 12
MSKPVAYKGFFDSALEASVAGSFTGVGLRMRKRLYTWEPLPPGALQGKVVVITGGTSGLGEHASMAMAKLGAHVTMVARDASKAARVCERLRELSGSAAIDAAQAEMGNLRAVRRAASELQERHGRGIDVLIHNAGALDAIYAESEEGIEQTVASQVVGPYLLTELLRPALRHRPDSARVLWVSSGGMYSEPLDVDNLCMRPTDYNGVTAYARAKRAQVTLTELQAERYLSDNIRVHGMHPGWADTPGVARSLPKFRALLGPLLRTPEEGADTLVWLAASNGLPLSENGKFWHDRAPRAIHKLRKTERSDTTAEREKLVAYLERVTT